MGFTTLNQRASGLGQGSRYRTTEPYLFFDQTLGAAAASFDILRIPQGWRHIRAMVGGGADGTTTQEHVFCRFNNDTGSNYSWQEVRGTATTADGIEATSSTSIIVGYTGDEVAANEQNMCEFIVPYYATASFHKVVRAHESVKLRPGTAFCAVVTFTGYWFGTPAAINRMTLFPETGNFIAGTRCSVWLEP